MPKAMGGSQHWLLWDAIAIVVSFDVLAIVVLVTVCSFRLVRWLGRMLYVRKPVFGPELKRTNLISFATLDSRPIVLKTPEVGQSENKLNAVLTIPSTCADSRSKICGIMHTMAHVIPDEITRAVRLAGFEPIETIEPARRVFTRRQCTLVINDDAKWSCHWQASDVRRLCCAGYTFASLLDYVGDAAARYKQVGAPPHS